jgi:hypothetical protein
VSGTTIHNLIALTVAAADLAGVVCLFLMLRFYPASVTGRLSLRGRATELLLPNQKIARLRRSAREFAERHGRTAVLPFLLLALILWVPVPGPSLTSPITDTFADSKASSEFLGTMWQVVAGALGLSVAMIAFAFEAFVSLSQRQLGGSLREFARETRLLLAIQLGVLALLVDGLVLLGVGHEAPAGWAAAWATLLSAATLAGVPYVLSRVVRALDTDELLRMRRERLRASAAEALWHQLIGQAGDAVLQASPELSVERLLLKPAGRVALRAPSQGVLRDVDVGSLHRLSVRSQKAGRQLGFGLLVGLGERISDQSEVLAISGEATPRERKRALRALEVDPGRAGPPGRRFLDQLSRLHDQAMSAVREGREEDWRSIGDLYRSLLRGLVEAAEGFGVSFEGAIAAPGVFGFGPVQRIGGYIGEELKAAVAAENSGLVDAIAYLPGMIARDALGAGAMAVVREMLGLYPRMYWLAKKGADHGEASALLLDRSSTYLVEYDYLIEAPFDDASRSGQDREDGIELGRALFQNINAILKAALDLADAERFRDLERRWSNMLSEELAYQLPDASQAEIDLRGLYDYRAVLELGLAMWAAHRLMQAGTTQAEESTVSEALAILAARLPGGEELLDVYEGANEREERERGVPWTSWFLGELDSEEAHMIPTSSELIFTTMLLLVVGLDTGEVELKPRPWFEYREEEMAQAAARLREEAGRWSSVFAGANSVDGPAAEGPHEGDWLERVARLEALVERAREGAIEFRRAEIREAATDPALVAEFRRAVLGAAGKGRLVHDLFETQGAFCKREGKPEEPVGGRTWLSKRLFIPDSHVIGLESNARSLARFAHGAEMRRLVELLERVEASAPGGEIADRLREEVRIRAVAGRPATLLLLPISWRLRQGLGLTMFGSQGVGSHLVPAGRAAEFDGLFDDVPVLDTPYAPKDRLWLIDLPAFGRFLEWPSEQDSGARLELRSFDAAAAARFVADQPEVVGDDGDVEAAVRAAQEQVLCELTTTWRIEPSDEVASAALCLPVPAHLQH